jgi:purine-binding chemotaxis protein CheW
VDRALELVEVSSEAIESADRVAPGVEHVEGVARLPEGLVVIHDLERFLSLDEGARLDTALRAGGGEAEVA